MKLAIAFHLLSVLGYCMLFAASVSAQDLSVGIVAGTNLTNDFRSQYFFVPYDPANSYFEESGSASFIVGAMVEWRFGGGFSIEADGLYRGLHGRGISPLNVVTWEFPVLAKYRFNLPFAKPFVEGGPSFRTAANLNWANPSHAGFTAGVGLEEHLKGLAILPEIRYTHWERDSNGEGVLSKPDQIEFLVGFSGNSGSDSSPFGRSVSIGAVLGTNLTGDYSAVSYPINLTYANPDGVLVSVNAIGKTESGGKSLLVGPALEVRLPRKFSLEVDAVYRPLRSVALIVVPSSYIFSRTDIKLVTWQFPVLAKYKLDGPFKNGLLKPFLEAGPSFRLPQETNFSQLSTDGVTAGVGVQTHVGGFKISPALRYTYWGADSPRGQSGVYRNELQFLVGFSF